MVEGPGCISNGRKARRHVGRLVVGVNGQAAKAVAPAVRGRCLVSVLTLGEEEEGINSSMLCHACMQFAQVPVHTNS